MTRLSPAHVRRTYCMLVALLELPTGGLADALGRRPVLVLGTVCNLAYLGLLLIALASVLHGAERALWSGPLEAWFVDTSRALDPEVDLRRGLTGGAIADGAAVGVGALAAGLLPQLATGLPEGYLERRDYVRRVPDPSDGRGRVVVYANRDIRAGELATTFFADILGASRPHGADTPKVSVP